MHDLTTMTQRVADLVTATDDEQLDAPTPCAELTVRRLLAHLHGLSVAFAEAAHKLSGSNTVPPPAPDKLALPNDWRESTPVALRSLAAAWSEPAAWQGMTHAAGLTMTGEQAGIAALDEVTLHGWDLAVATRQPYSVTDEALAVVESFCASVPDEPDARQGLFGPRVAVADDAPRLDRVLGLAGRDPAWSAPSARDSS